MQKTKTNPLIYILVAAALLVVAGLIAVFVVQNRSEALPVSEDDHEATLSDTPDTVNIEEDNSVTVTSEVEAPENMIPEEDRECIPTTPSVASDGMEVDILAEYATGRRSFGGVILKSLDLSGADLRGIHMGDTNLSTVNFSNANLANANIGSSNLSCANLAGANLEGAYLGFVDMTNANLAGANLRDADLRDADMRNANLEGACLAGVETWETRNTARWPDWTTYWPPTESFTPADC